ncbi:MAG: AtpZ/AtpI family protein [Crocinitomix sp.]|nr:AtpZ/AtpI family protein [Crocinitomix sp.]
MKKSNKNPYFIFSSMAIQMGLTIGVGAYIGTLLDAHYQNAKPIWTIILSLLGVAVSLYLLIRGAKRINDDE